MKQRLLGLALGGAAAYLTQKLLPESESWIRQNFAGKPVSLRGGVASAITATACSAVTILASPRIGLAATALSAVSAGAGYFDDMDQGRHDGDHTAKGLGGHLGALREGHISSGLIKLGSIGAASAVAATVLPHRRGMLGCADWVAGTVLLAGGTNMINLLDLRPVRARKAVLATSIPTLLARGDASIIGAAATAAAAGGFSDDGRGKTMLGDTGANSLGALASFGVGLAMPLTGRYAAAALLVAATLASEKISFSEVIANSPILSRIDAWGRPDGV